MLLDFDCIFYYVSDMDRSIRFYADLLGFRLLSRDFVARFEINGVLFELVPSSESRVPECHANGGLCLKADDIKSAVAEIRTKGISTSDPEPKGNGLLASFHDPDFNEIWLWQYTSSQGEE